MGKSDSFGTIPTVKKDVKAEALEAPQELWSIPPTPVTQKYTADIEAPKYVDERLQEYFEIKQAPLDSMLLVDLLRGILPVSEIVAREESGGWQYYSHRTPIEGLPTKTEMEVGADLAILGEVFGDRDRHIGGHNMQVLEASPGNFKVSYHDFEKFRRFSISPRSSDEWARIIPVKEKSLRIIAKQFETQRFLDVFENKLDLLEKRLSGPQAINHLVSAVQSFPSIPPVLCLAERASEQELREKVWEFQSAVLMQIRALREACARIRNQPDNEKETS